MLKTKEEYIKTVRRTYPPLLSTFHMEGFSKEEQFKRIYKEPFAVRNEIISDFNIYFSKKEIGEGGRIALESWGSPSSLKYIKKEFKHLEQNLINSAKKSFEEFCGAYLQYMPVLISVFFSEKSVEDALRKELFKKFSPEETNNLMLELNLPLEENFYRIEELDLVKTNNIEKHVKKYEWLYARYGQETHYTLEEALAKLKNINREEFLRARKETKAKLIKNIKKAKKLLGPKSYLGDLFQFLIFYRTHRTDVMNKSAYLALPILKEKAKSLGLTYKELLHCTVSEILSENIPEQSILQERIKNFVMVLEDEKISCLIGKEAQKIKDFLKEDQILATEFKGNVACRGLVKGKVKLIFWPEDFKKIKNGDILVTSMTTPQMIPIMAKASAFITDEGGVTSHAAIISRELGKPCIIGTKIATKVLKDGDLVEVDAEKGIVRILKD